MNKKQILISTALTDLWKENSIPMEEKEIETVLNEWTSEELMEFISTSIDTPFGEFTLEYTRSQIWKVTHACHEERDKDLKKALYRMLQHFLTEGKVTKQNLEGIDPKYLDFFSPDYGEKLEDSDDIE